MWPATAVWKSWTLLCQGERTIEVLAGDAGLSVANTSQHLQVLRAAHLVETEKSGQYVTYRDGRKPVGRIAEERGAGGSGGMILIILNDPPYGTEHGFNGLRLANQRLKTDPPVPPVKYVISDNVELTVAGVYHR